MKKVTVNHVLNKSIKARFNGKTNTYPIYVNVIADRVHYKMRSNFEYWDGYVTEMDFNSQFVQNSLNYEKQKIEKAVLYLIENQINEYLNAKGFKMLSENLFLCLNRTFWRFFELEVKRIKDEEIPNAFINATFFEIDELLKFTDAEIESKLSSEYGMAKNSVYSILYAHMYPDLAELNLSDVSVFEFLYDNNIRINIVKAVEYFNGFHGGDKKEIHNEILNSVKNVVLLGGE